MHSQLPRFLVSIILSEFRPIAQNCFLNFTTTAHNHFRHPILTLNVSNSIKFHFHFVENSDRRLQRECPGSVKHVNTGSSLYSHPHFFRIIYRRLSPRSCMSPHWVIMANERCSRGLSAVSIQRTQHTQGKFLAKEISRKESSRSLSHLLMSFLL